ncbi:hypothetical protein [Cellulosimicrobium sp. Marseille-Q4280]|uniref:hypothetical protein n=1 Tax=Cellulosimicrobium sp. Marseille-Q4280 TaxID=2937992 RepID=UPI00203C3DCA|nr:hypothetical protein [Cellulosimicrobium sp. Marseille-Q4280]
MSDQPVTLTPAQERTLVALREACDRLVGTAQVPARYASAREIALALWPDSPAWQHRTNRGSGGGNGAVGGTMPMKAGTLLWKLWKAGYARNEFDSIGPPWSISDKGRAYLKERGL